MLVCSVLMSHGVMLPGSAMATAAAPAPAVPASQGQWPFLEAAEESRMAEGACLGAGAGGRGSAGQACPEPNLSHCCLSSTASSLSSTDLASTSCRLCPCFI